MSFPEGQLNGQFKCMEDSLRGMAELALQQENAQMIALLAAAGKIAAGIKEFQDTLLPATAQEQPIAPVFDAEPVVPDELTGPLFVVDEESGQLQLAEGVDEYEVLPRLRTVSQEVEEPAQIEKMAVEAEVASVTDLVEPPVGAEVDPFKYLRERYPALKLTDREAAFLQRIQTMNGRFKAGQIHDGGPAGKQAFSKFTQKFAESPYAPELLAQGIRGGRTYEYVGYTGDRQTLPVTTEAAPAPVVIEAPRPAFTPNLMPKQRIEHPAVPVALEEDEEVRIEHDEPTVAEAPQPTVDRLPAVFERFNLQLSENGHKYLSVRGVPLKVSDLGVTVFLEVARSEQPLTYRDLLRTNNIQALVGKEANPAKHLNTALVELEKALAGHELPWFDDHHSHVGGKKVRTFGFGHETTDANKKEPAFLASGL